MPGFLGMLLVNSRNAKYSFDAWKSSKPAMAGIDEKGVITVHKRDSAIIKCEKI